MTNNQSGLLCLFVIALLFVILLPALAKLEGHDKWYEKGWKACLKAYKHFEMTADDEIVLKNLKSALRAHIDSKGYRRKGDVKRIAQIKDFDELRDVTWEICTRKDTGGKRNV